MLAAGLGAVAQPAAAHAQWWSRAPVDYEDCAERAEKTAASKEARAELLSQCEAKFAGRRKPGGGYTYYDFMQDRHFDIAGPNPTTEEQRQFDQHYTAFLDEQRRNIIAAAFAQRQRELTEAERARKPAPQPQGGKPPPRLASASATPDARRPTAPRPAKSTASPPRPTIGIGSGSAAASRGQRSACGDNALSCGWSQLAAGVSSLKKSLFGPPPKKTKRSS
nr:hypothetical protein [Rhodopseudomonas rhenobacensis]